MPKISTLPLGGTIFVVPAFIPNFIATQGTTILVFARVVTMQFIAMAAVLLAFDDVVVLVLMFMKT